MKMMIRALLTFLRIIFVIYLKKPPKHRLLSLKFDKVIYIQQTIWCSYGFLILKLTLLLELLRINGSKSALLI